MRAVRSTLVLAAVAVMAMVATGCGRLVGAGDSIGSEPGMDTGPVGVSCADLGLPADPGASPAPSPTVTQVPLPAGFVPVAATRCLVRYENVPGDGEWITRVEQRAEGDLSAVAAELRRPDVTDPPGTACPAIGYLPTIITLIDATGATTVPTIPHAGCGAPMRSVLRAIDDLPWQTGSETRVRRVRSELEVTSGCNGSYKPVIALVAAESGGPAPVIGPVFATMPGALQVCRYELSAHETLEVAGTSVGLGVLTSASTIDGATMTAFVQALATAPAAARPCTQPPAPFAEVHPKDERGRTIAVELGGCYRFMDPLGGLRQLDAATVAALQA
jgi:hypothetical protein